MGATGVTEETAFVSREELCDVLDRLFTAVDEDPALVSKMRSTRTPQRLNFPDLGVLVDITAAERGDHALRWEFSERADWKPKLTMEMDSAVANRYLQGKENLAIAIARGRIKVSCEEARAALSLLPANRQLIGHYRQIIESEYPHLALD